MDFELPLDFTNRMKEMLKDEYDEFIASYEDSNYHGLRLNTLKVGPENRSEFISKLDELFDLRPVPWCNTGFYYEDDKRPGRHPFHHGGAYYIQEPSAMLVGELADVKPGMRVLDLCAAPGGKTSHLAMKMQGEGLLVANEIVPSRAKILSQNVERMGISNCIVTNESPERLEKSFSSYFDLIVTDVPCSGEGMFRRDEIARNEWSLDNVNICHKRGQDILNQADKMLKYGGKLVYSTCTFAPLENEIAIIDFIKNHPMYKIEKVNLSMSEAADKKDGWPDSGRKSWCRYSNTEADISVETDIDEKSGINIEDTFRLWPHRLHGEGHFCAVLIKGEAREFEATATDKVKKQNKNDQKELIEAIKLFKDFFDKNIRKELKGDYKLFANNLYLLPALAPSLDKLRIERAGLHLGEIKKNRFEPSHALAMSLKSDEANSSFCLKDENEAIKYLSGESINSDFKNTGWGLVEFDKIVLGWGKANGGLLKNHYPKGLRIMR